MTMREWCEYYCSANRERVLNVISLEFSKTKSVSLHAVRMTELLSHSHIRFVQVVRLGDAASRGARAELGGDVLAQGRAGRVHQAVRAEVLPDERQGLVHRLPHRLRRNFSVVPRAEGAF